MTRSFNVMVATCMVKASHWLTLLPYKLRFQFEQGHHRSSTTGCVQVYTHCFVVIHYVYYPRCTHNKDTNTRSLYQLCTCSNVISWLTCTCLYTESTQHVFIFENTSWLTVTTNFDQNIPLPGTVDSMYCYSTLVLHSTPYPSTGTCDYTMHFDPNAHVPTCMCSTYLGGRGPQVCPHKNVQCTI